MIAGILDKNALSNYQEDMKQIFEDITKSQEAGTNIEFFESRYKMLDEEVDKLEIKRAEVKNELRATISKLQGELVTIDQMFRYLGKELGACEMKLKEAKGEI